MTEESPTDPDHGSKEFQALTVAVRRYSRLIDQSRSRPMSTDPVDLLRALSEVGEASVAMVRNAGAL